MDMQTINSQFTKISFQHSSNKESNKSLYSSNFKHFQSPTFVEPLDWNE